MNTTQSVTDTITTKPSFDHLRTDSVVSNRSTVSLTTEQTPRKNFISNKKKQEQYFYYEFFN